MKTVLPGLFVCVAPALVGLAACATLDPTPTLSRADLEIAASRHHINLRWGRLEPAAAFVSEPQREAFVAEWERLLHRADLHELDVLSVEPGARDDEIMVLVRMTVVEKSSQRVRGQLLSETWRKKDEAWSLVSWNREDAPAL